MEPYIERMNAAGYGGLAIWKTQQGYMGCLLAFDRTEPLYNTNLWNYQASALEVAAALADFAERNPRQ